MSESLAPRFSPAEVENRIYEKWEKEKAFAPSKGGGEAFTIMIPPPNVTGALHMGHGLNNTLQDTVIRFQRMRGKKALWMPGTDHAGIATQNVVEKKLKKEGKSRQDLGRDKFVEEVWSWKDHYEKRILGQLKRLGASCDWDRTRFTMDEGLSAAVVEAFVRWFDRGLVYRGHYIVNWCPRCQTALSDEESEHKDVKGKLWKFRYPIKNGSGAALEIATTRPETMLGDVAVAVNPDDIRYKKLVGQLLELPLVGREIPVISDKFVDKEFGTGAVKVTPAHDPNDFQMGQRHELEPICVMAPDGKMNENAPETYRGMDRFEARKQVLKDLEEKGLLVGEENHDHSVGHCYRCNTVVEPYLSEQWFVKATELAKKAIEAQEKGLIQFHPARWEKFYLSWLNNIRDWCISRQLWWGHRIPVWTCNACKEYKAYRQEPQKCESCGGTSLTQDPDVLDTWFSSQLWPFSTLGWPNLADEQIKKEISTFYPTDLLSTARDIIFFWVARMVMAGLDLMLGEKLEDKIPFKHVYIHPTVLDAQGRRMSKSLGNGIDPIEMIDQYGADAMRYSLMILTKEGQDIKLSPTKFVQGRNFCNKVWNAARFVLMNLEKRPQADPKNATRVEDLWILGKLNATIEDVTDRIEKYQLNDAAQALYRFIWDDFCDWYLEAAKLRLQGGDEDAEMVRSVLVHVLNQSLRLLHPFTPFITEEIWEKLGDFVPDEEASLLIQSRWPQSDHSWGDEKASTQFHMLQDVTRAIRNVRAINNMPANEKPKPIISVSNQNDQTFLIDHGFLISNFCGTEQPEVAVEVDRPESTGLDVFRGGTVYVPLGDSVDIEAQKKVLEKKIQKVESGLKAIGSKLKNEGFLMNADPEMVESEKQRQKSLQEEQRVLQENLKGL